MIRVRDGTELEAWISKPSNLKEKLPTILTLTQYDIDGGRHADSPANFTRRGYVFVRAYVRGRCIQKFSASVISAQWDHITLQGSHGPLKISLLDVFTDEEVAAFAKVVDAAKTPDDLKPIAEEANN